ncbi:glycosyltransferase family 2 protein [Niallia taxi]|uniref:glycosyltransferase family 2 protein n=1 Tax=Niallia taxi TaxID=2499688 RepID=UPI003D2C9DDE
MKKITVIVPIYNVQEYLDRCLKSIIGQTYKNLEIILVNDGSTDSSGEICDNYAVRDSRIRVIHKENGGLSDARNVGIQAATGNYIGFVDSDDFIHKDFYHVLYNTIVNYQCDVVEVGYKEVYEYEVDLSDDDFMENDEASIIKYFEKDKAVINSILDHDLRNYAWNKLYKKELWNNIKFPKGKLFEDVFTTYQIFNCCTKIVKVEKVLYYYFQRADSIVNSKFSLKKLDHFEALNEVMDFMEDNYPKAAPITYIKYYMESLNYLSILMQNRNSIENSSQIIKTMKSKLTNSNNMRHLSSSIDIEQLCKQFLKDNYRELLVKRKKIKYKVLLLKFSVWPFYLQTVAFNGLRKMLS